MEDENQLENLAPIFISRAGLVILAPYLNMLFDKCDLLEEGNFINEESKSRAVHLLEYAATGQTIFDEHEVVMHKILCGLTLSESVDLSIDLSTLQKETVESMLNAVTQNWPGMESNSINVLRETFLLRDGKLEELAEFFYVKVEQKSLDILMDRIPWSVSTIKLSWMEKTIDVIWR